MAMKFEEEAAELHRLEAVALSRGLTHSQFQRIALEVNAEGLAKGLSPEEQLAEIRRRISNVDARLISRS
jgi:hypothetical protein